MMVGRMDHMMMMMMIFRILLLSKLGCTKVMNGSQDNLDAETMDDMPAHRHNDFVRCI